MKLRKTKKGFTIVELVIVIGVIGILTGILIPTFVNVTQKAEEAAAKSEVASAYSMYLTLATDGKGTIPEENFKDITGEAYDNTKVYTLKSLKQGEAVLKRKDVYWNFNTDKNEWTNYTLPENHKYVSVATEKAGDSEATELVVTFNGVSVWEVVENS